MKFGYQGAYHADNRAPERQRRLAYRVQQRRAEPAHAEIIDYRTSRTRASGTTRSTRRTSGRAGG